MKSVYISGYDDSFIRALSSTMGNNYNKFFDIMGEEVFNEDVIRNASFSQPDFFICDSIDVKNAIEIFENCPNTTIIICGDDINRTNATSTDLNKDGYYNVVALSKDTTSPRELCEKLITYEEEIHENKVQNDVIEVVEETKENSENEDTINLEDFAKKYENVKEQVNDTELQEELKAPVLDIDTPVENVERKVITEVEYKSLNLSNIRSKTIAVFSVKGGSGKTTIARELANVFNLVKLPKKLVNGTNNLKTVVVDLDFERGNLRTMLGVENTPTNIYNFIGNILDKLESGIPLDKIRYNSLEIMERYTFVLDNNYRVMLTAQNDLPPRIINRINLLDRDGDLFEKIIKLIVKTLRNVFDVVIFDLPSGFNDLTETVLEMVDDIIYPMNPTLCDIDGFKVFNDEIQKNKAVKPEKVHPVLNRCSKKIKFMNEFDDVFRLIKYEAIDENTNRRVQVSYNCFLKIPEMYEIVNFQNDIRKFHFASVQGPSNLKQPFLTIASDILPVFKNVNSNQQLEKYRKNLRKKELQKEKIRKTEELAKQKRNKNKKGLDVKENVAETKEENKPLDNMPPKKLTKKEKKLLLKQKKAEMKKKKLEAKKKR